VWSFAGIAGLLGTPSIIPAAEARNGVVAAERSALDARVSAVRSSLQAAEADHAKRDGNDVASIAQWFNWPNWGNWNNWPNWGNWGNWNNWFNR